MGANTYRVMSGLGADTPDDEAGMDEVITGSTGYDRIYDSYPDVALDMVASRTFDGRIQLLEYVPTVLAGPPGAQPGS
jgi:hypothetical protein